MKAIDDTLWKSCIAGDIAAFEELYYRFYSVLYSYGIKLVRDKQAVEDCIHDLFVKMIRNHKNLSPTPYLTGYLIKSFRNMVYDRLEREKHTDDITGHEDEFAADDLFSSLFGGDNMLDADMERLKKALKELSARQQEILYLYFVNNLNHEEIAAVLEINYQSSKNLLFRSLSKLRRSF